MHCVTEYHESTHTFFIRNVNNDAMKKVVIPPMAKSLLIDGDYLDELVIPEGIVFCACPNLGLRTLIVPDSVEHLFCNRNTLRDLELPKSLYSLDASHNPLYTVSFRAEMPAISILRMRSVKATTLDFKVNEFCEVDLRDNRQLVNLSPELRNACIKNPCYEEEFDMKREMLFYDNRAF